MNWIKTSLPKILLLVVFVSVLVVSHRLALEFGVVGGVLRSLLWVVGDADLSARLELFVVSVDQRSDLESVVGEAGAVCFDLFITKIYHINIILYRITIYQYNT